MPELRAKLLRELAPAAGLVAILFSLLWVRSEMPFPGWVALLPCLGTAFIIHAGGRSWLASRVLSARPVVFVGLLSYSLYLWHWPILAGLKVYTARPHLDPAWAAAALPVIFFVSWLSWRYVEQPFRSRSAMPWPRMIQILGGGSAAALAVSAVSIVAMGFPGRLDQPARLALAAANDIDPLRDPCEDGTRTAACKFGPPGSKVSYAIVGDSHAAAIRPAVEASGIMGPAAGTLFWKPTCPLLDGAEIINLAGQAECTDFKNRMWQEIESNRDLRTIILVGRWPYQVIGTRPESGGSNRTWLVDEDTIEPSAEESKRVFVRSLKRTIDRLHELNRVVIIIGSVPEASFDVPHTIAVARQMGRPISMGIDRSAAAKRLSEADSLLAKVASEHPGTRFLRIWDSFCVKTLCLTERDGVPIYSDENHLSYHGALNVVAPALKLAFARSENQQAARNSIGN